MSAIAESIGMKISSVCVFISARSLVYSFTQFVPVASPRGGLGCTCPPPLLLEVAPEIDTNLTRVGGGSLRLQTPVIGSRSALAMSVHPTYFDLATPLIRSFAYLSLCVDLLKHYGRLFLSLSIVYIYAWKKTTIIRPEFSADI